MSVKKSTRAAGDHPDRGDARSEANVGPLRIRKYSNRRLYDQSTSRHLTHEQLYDLVAAGHDVVVVDAKSEEDITNVVLAQLLIERDPLKLTAFPANLLHALIRSNERMLQSTVTRHLAAMLESMSQFQRQAQRGSRGDAIGLSPLMPFDPTGPLGPMEWMARLFAPPGRALPPVAPTEVDEEDSDRSTPLDESSAEAIRALRDEVAALREQLDSLEGRDRGTEGPRKTGRARTSVKAQTKARVQPQTKDQTKDQTKAETRAPGGTPKTRRTRPTER